MSRLLALVLALLPAFVTAAPFLVSDPWLATDPQPDACSYTEPPSATPRPLTLNVNTAGQKFIRSDLAGTTNGAHTFVITCSNALWGLASAPVNFTFTAAAPTAPAGLRIAP